MPEVRNVEVYQIRDEIPPQYAKRDREDLSQLACEPIDAQFEAVTGNGYDDQGLSGGGLGSGMFRGRSFVPDKKKRQIGARPSNLKQVGMNRHGEALLNGLGNSLTDYASANPGTTLLALGGIAFLAGILLKKR